jgi:hypothetical protein
MTHPLLIGEVNHSIFSRVRQSERVNGLCCICGNEIPYLFKPANEDEYVLLFRYADLEEIKICKQCSSLRHALCSIERKRERRRMSGAANGPSMIEAMRDALAGGEKGLRTFADALEKDVKGLECPKCGSFGTLEAYAQRDGAIIKTKSGRRIES